jgi:hypothetical protein
MPKSAVFFLLAAIALNAGAQSSKPADVWLSAGHIHLTAADAASGLSAEWQFDRADNGDVRLIKNERRSSGTVSGTLLSVCSDQAILFKDMVPASRHELRELDEPVLHLQLVLRLLARAMPDGLPRDGSETAIDIGDDKTTLRLRKGHSARKDIGAPWRARGTARRRGSDVRYDLAVSYAGDNPPHPRMELKVAGLWSAQSRVKALDNALNLAGWRVHRVDIESDVVGGNTVFDSVARTAPLTFATLGDVRAAIGRSWNPNAKAAQRMECKI